MRGAIEEGVCLMFFGGMFYLVLSGFFGVWIF